MQGDVLLWGYGSLDGSFVDWRREAWKGYVDSSIWLAVLVAAVYWRRHLVPRVRSGVLLLLAIQLGSLLFMNPWAALVKKSQPSMVKLDLPDRLIRFSGSHNVIHIVLDGFQSDVFEELVEGSERYRENFRGFTFFREATTSTRVTHLSFPPFISASTYRNRIPAWKYKRKLPARTPLKNTRENFRRQSAYTLEWVLQFLDKLRKLSIYDDSTIIQADHGSGLSFQLQDRTGQWIDSRKCSLRISGAVLPLFLVKPALSKGVLRVSDAQVELNDLPPRRIWRQEYF